MFRAGMLIGVLCLLAALAALFVLPRTTPPPSPDAVLETAR